FIKERVRKFGTRQRIKDALIRSITILENEKPDDDTSIIEIPRLFEEACRAGISEDKGTVFAEEAQNLPEILRDDMIYGAVNKVPTGIQALDMALNGGLGIPEIGVLAGSPNRGKSTNLCVFGANAARHFRNMYL